MTLYSVHMTDQDVRCVSDIMVSKKIFMKLDGEDYSFCCDGHYVH